MTAHHEPPRIVHIIYALSTGGLENGLVNIINGTPPGRFEHMIVCITGADNFAGRITAEGVRVFELHKRAGHDWGFYRRLRQLLRALQPDIIHSRNLAALEAQLCGLLLPGVKRVHGEHGREINDLDGSNWKYLALRRCLRPFIHRYIAVSKDLEQWLLHSVGVRRSRLRQIYNGVDCERFAPRQSKPRDLLPAHWPQHTDTLILGTVGRLTPVKDQRQLLLAMAALRSEQPALFVRLYLVMVGDGPLRDELTALTAKLHLTEQVWFAGDRDDVPALLSCMDLFVLPSLAEGVSNTVLEAMAAGLPVVATAVGGNTELVTEGVNGALVPVADVPALSRVLAKLLTDDAGREALGRNARDGVRQRFNWPRTVAAYLQVYDELLSRPVAGRAQGAA